MAARPFFAEEYAGSTAGMRSAKSYAFLSFADKPSTMGLSGSVQPESRYVPVSFVPRGTRSNCPPLTATSCWILARMSFSVSMTIFTLMPVSLVKADDIFCIVTIGALLTEATTTVEEDPLPPVVPVVLFVELHAASDARTAGDAAPTVNSRRVIVVIVYLHMS